MTDADPRRLTEGNRVPGNDDLLAKLPIARIAAELGVDGDTATATLRLTLPALLVGMKANAQDPAGAESLSKAISQHPGEVVGPTFDINLLNPVEGAKIVANVFGQNTEAVVLRLAGSPPVAAVGTALTRKALNIMAPVVLTYLNQAYVESQRPKPAATTPPPSPALQELLDRLVPTATAAAAGTAAAAANATASATAAATAAVRAATPKPVAPARPTVRGEVTDSTPVVSEPEPRPAAASPAATSSASAETPRASGSVRADAAALAGSAGQAAATAAVGAVERANTLLSGLLGAGRKA